MTDGDETLRCEEFWRWFKENHRRLDPYAFDPAAIEPLERLLDEMGGFDWEVGVLPGDEGNYFAFSPRGQVGLLEACRRIVATAPQVAGWRFLAAKPAKPGELALFVRGSEDEEIEVDASGWEFVVYRFPDGLCDILFKPDVDMSIDLDAVAVAIVDNELGEENRLMLTRHIGIVSDWDERERDAACRLEPGLLPKYVMDQSAARV